MKIHRQDLLALQAAIDRRFNASDRAAIHDRYRARGLSDQRFRWDMLHASGFDIQPLYKAGLNDSHIDTALRYVMPARA